MTSNRPVMLLDTSPLPEGWSPLEIVEDTILVRGVALHRAGVASTGPGGEEVTGSGAESNEAPVRRSYFELLERVATLEALGRKSATYDLLTAEGAAAGTRTALEVFPESSDPSRWRYARSNGVALHAGWEAACTRAKWELAERDRVLRSWYGEVAPSRVALPPSSPLASVDGYEWIACIFPELDTTSFSLGVEVAGVFGLPSLPDAPLVLGFGARDNGAAALHAASTEATQLLAFLWGEPLPDTAPAIGPSAGHHLDYFQWGPHQRELRRWLLGERSAPSTPFVPSLRLANAPRSETSFVDLTPAWLGNGLRVAKALSPAAMPLIFGESPSPLPFPFVRDVPRELGPHPIG